MNTSEQKTVIKPKKKRGRKKKTYEQMIKELDWKLVDYRK